MRIKSPLCCLLHHDPRIGRVYAFQSLHERHRFNSWFPQASSLWPVVALRIELSATRLSAGYGQPALDYRQSRAPRSRTETLLLPKQACFHLHLCPIVSSPCGSRTQPARLERPMTSPEVERAVLCAYAEREVGREALESSSAVLQTAARPSQLPAQVVVVEARKKARCRS